MKLNQLITIMLLILISVVISIIGMICSVDDSTIYIVAMPLLVIVGGYLGICWVVEEVYAHVNKKALQASPEEPEDE